MIDDDISKAECNAYLLAMFHVKGFVNQLVKLGYFNKEVVEPIIGYIDDRINYVENSKKD